MNDDLYRTSDMAMVTYLRMNGHAVQNIVWDSSGYTAYWQFLKTESLIGATDDFTSGRARVDPRMFNRDFAKTKAEFHNISRK
jgi:hypothetical protein